MFPLEQSQLAFEVSLTWFVTFRLDHSFHGEASVLENLVGSLIVHIKDHSRRILIQVVEGCMVLVVVN